MSNPNGLSGQGGSLTIDSTTLACSKMKLRKVYNNADTTVTDAGWGQITPVVRDWFIDVEIPWTGTVQGIDELFDASDYDTATPTGQAVTFTLPNAQTYSGQACLDGDYSVDDSARDAVRLVFTLKGTGALTGPS